MGPLQEEKKEIVKEVTPLQQSNEENQILQTKKEDKETQSFQKVESIKIESLNDVQQNEKTNFLEDVISVEDKSISNQEKYFENEHSIETENINSNSDKNNNQSTQQIKKKNPFFLAVAEKSSKQSI